MQSSGQVNIRLISQLTHGILRVFQKLLRHSSGTHISVFFVPSFPVLTLHFLYANKILVSPLTEKSIILPSLSKAGWSL